MCVNNLVYGLKLGKQARLPVKIATHKGYEKYFNP